MCHSQESSTLLLGDNKESVCVRSVHHFYGFGYYKCHRVTSFINEHRQVTVAIIIQVKNKKMRLVHKTIKALKYVCVHSEQNLPNSESEDVNLKLLNTSYKPVI